MRTRYRPSSRSPEFRWFGGAQAVSMIGNAMTNTALYWLGIHLAHGHALGLSVLAAAQFLPMLFLSRRAGLLAEQHRPGRVLAFTTMAECAGALAIGIPLAAGWMTIWYLWVLGFGIGCAQALGQAAGQMFMLDLVGQADLRRGASVSSMVTGLSKIAGPGLLHDRDRRRRAGVSDRRGIVRRSHSDPALAHADDLVGCQSRGGTRDNGPAIALGAAAAAWHPAGRRGGPAHRRLRLPVRDH